MSRKLRSSEVIEQLGEPLPLPYLVDTPKATKSGAVPNESNISPPNQLADHILRRKNRILSGESRLEQVHQVKEPVVYPLRLLRQAEAEVDKESILDEIERKIQLLKVDMKNFKDSSSALIVLERINKDLDEIQQWKQHDSILGELERLQNQTSALENPGFSGRYRIAAVVTILACLLGLSFFAGQYSYEYCYYFC
ncbi:hypothetical protein PUMCH_001100 [Australozyma saopauloensis]|uniref:Uncharacterized protein n=1 Tax=Australozyma saopauloensis TaxID=291208 RepID=A0AAX4H7Z8_9ASCO|nr:hypothetical protein PUMCH_001100 [[Candida] saopauloensis]